MDQFWKACGARGPLVLEIEGPGCAPGERKTFDQPFVLIGRDGRADVALDHDDVSRRHVYLQAIDGRVIGVDLGTRSGTHWPDGPRNSGWLDPGQPIQVGPYRIRLAALEGACGERGVDREAILPRVVLHHQGEAGRQSAFVQRPLAAMGSRVGCNPRFDHSSVSSLHCILARTPDGVWVVDLLSRYGIAVNGSITRVGQLADGDSLTVGRLVIDVEVRPPGTGGLPAVVVESGRVPAAVATDPALAALMQQFGLLQQQTFEQVQQMMMMVVQTLGALHRDQMNELRAEMRRITQLGEELRGLRPSPYGAPPPAAAQPSFVTITPPPVFTPPNPAPSVPDPANAAVDDAFVLLQERLDAIQRERQTRWQKVLSLVPGLGGEGFVP